MISRNKQKLAENTAKQLFLKLESCDICPRNCKVNRNQKLGFCQSSDQLKVYTAFLHQGEEPIISKANGSGTIFFSGCNLRCCYCQNFQFSQQNQGTVITPDQLAKIMINLQKAKADNINLVTPTHYLPQILTGLALAYNQGLTSPIVYNTSGYEKPEIIKSLDHIVDIYLTDLRYLDSDLGLKYSQAADYPQTNQESIKQMYQQKSTLIIRHLVLPGQVKHSINALSWIQKNTPNAFLSLMFQYQPYADAKKHPEINRKINQAEYDQVMEELAKLKIQGWAQELTPQENLAGAYFKPELEKYLK